MTSIAALTPSSLIYTALRLVAERDKWQEALFLIFSMIYEDDVETYSGRSDVSKMNMFIREHWDDAKPHTALQAWVNVILADKLRFTTPMQLLAAMTQLFEDDAWVGFDHLILSHLGDESSPAVAQAELDFPYEQSNDNEG